MAAHTTGIVSGIIDKQLFTGAMHLAHGPFFVSSASLHNGRRTANILHAVTFADFQTAEILDSKVFLPAH